MKGIDSPIGVFDSGLGGLTVFRELRKVLPNEDIVYLGDTARVPYGGKSEGVIKRYSEDNVHFLEEKGVKAVVVACNTASSVALKSLQDQFPHIPIVGVIEPVVNGLISCDHVKRVGVIGTRATIKSNVYQERIRNRLNVDVFARACPLFVPLVEEGWLDTPMTMMVIEHYLKPMKEAGIDTLILGCTHYPLLRRPIGYFMGENVNIMDSGYFTARELKRLLIDRELWKGPSAEPGKETFYVTDAVDTFKSVGELILKQEMLTIERI